MRTRLQSRLTGYATAVFVGAALITLAAAQLNWRALLISPMVLFALGNFVTGLPDDYLLRVLVA